MNHQINPKKSKWIKEQCNFKFMEKLLKEITLKDLCLKIALLKKKTQYQRIFGSLATKKWQNLTFKQKRVICIATRFDLKYTEAYSTTLLNFTQNKVRTGYSDLKSAFSKTLRNHKYL